MYDASASRMRFDGVSRNCLKDDSQPARGFSVADQPDVRFVDECSGLQRLAGVFVCQLLRGQPAQFLVDQRKQLVRRVLIACRDGIKHATDVAHGMVISVYRALPRSLPQRSGRR